MVTECKSIDKKHPPLSCSKLIAPAPPFLAARAPPRGFVPWRGGQREAMDVGRDPVAQEGARDGGHESLRGSPPVRNRRGLVRSVLAAVVAAIAVVAVIGVFAVVAAALCRCTQVRMVRSMFAPL